MDPNMQLVAAAQRGDIGLMRSALAQGADALDGALVAACNGDATLAAGYLIDLGANPRVIDDWPARKAAESGALDALRLLLERVSEDAARDIAARALGEAAACGREETVRWLLDTGAITLKEAGKDPLLRAAIGGHANLVTLFLERMGGGSPALLNEVLEKTVAATSGRAEVAWLLLKRGADVDALQPMARRVVLRLMDKTKPPSAPEIKAPA
jgi:hypothetical protein